MVKVRVCSCKRGLSFPKACGGEGDSTSTSTLSGQPRPVGGKALVGGKNYTIQDPGITSLVQHKRRAKNGYIITKQTL